MSVLKIKKRIFDIISKAEDGDKASRIFDGCIIALIVLSILAIILQSFETLANKYDTVFHVFEVITVIVFTIEYLLRI